MKQIFRFLSLAVCALFVMVVCHSCDRPEDPEFTSYVTYNISGNELTFDGPEQLLPDIKAWFKDNVISYDVKLSYSTGEASEFTASDEAAVKKYDQEYMPKFRAFMNDLRSKLSSGAYGKLENVKITFCTYASRVQGKQNTLKYEQHEFSYPSSEE